MGALRVLLLATGHAMAPPVLGALLRAGHRVVALATPGSTPRRRTPRRVLLGADVADLAQQHGVEVWDVPGAAHAERVLEATRPDLVVVACFPWRLSEAFWTAPPWGGVNVHPSLLPSYRGPVPLFWQYRAGDMATGVSVHHLDARLDAGPIVAQQAVALDDALDVDGAERALGAVAGRLLVEALDAGTLPRADQSPHRASRQGWPKTLDLEVDPTWTARRAYRFVRLAGGTWPLRLTVADTTLCLRSASGWSPERPPAPLERHAGGWRTRFADGAVELGPRDAHEVR